MGLNPFGGKLRVRVCGILEEEGRVLMVKIQSPMRDEPFWMPPGGGVEFGETLEDALKREFQEETGLTIAVRSFRFVREYINLPWHAVELYYDVVRTGGHMQTGSDPELPDTGQMLLETRWIHRDDFQNYPILPDGL